LYDSWAIVVAQENAIAHQSASQRFGRIQHCYRILKKVHLRSAI